MSLLESIQLDTIHDAGMSMCDGLRQALIRHGPDPQSLLVAITSLRVLLAALKAANPEIYYAVMKGFPNDYPSGHS